MDRAELEKQAEELGLKIDNRWSDETLQEKINDALNATPEPVKPAKPAAEKLFPVKLIRNYRPVSPIFQVKGDEDKYREPTEDESMKVKAGTFIKLPIEEAQAVIDKKIAERNDPIR